jgi:hypothetical protein
MSKQDFLKLKADLLVEGIAAEETALEGLGTYFKEQNHGLFGWDFENHVGMTLPDDFALPDDTIVQFRLNSTSHYRIRMLDSTRKLFNNNDEICEIEWLQRPAFYDRVTAAGDSMVRIGQIGGADCLFFCYQNYCSHFAHHRECLFCNLVSTSQTYQSVLKRKKINAIGEVTKAAWAEGGVKHILLTGGCFNAEHEVRLVTDIIAAIRKELGFDRVPGTILPSPAKGDDIRRYYDTGIQAIGFSMEIWNDRLYQAICPGKSEATSHAEFMASIRSAVKVFGEGNVYAVFVMGLEPRESLLDGFRWLADTGANVVPFAWSPNPGSQLAGHRAPTAAWFADVVREGAEIFAESNIPSGVENHCFRCDGNNLLHDALREKGIE